MSRSGSPTIRARLVVLVLAVAAPAGAITAGLLAYEHLQDRKRQERDSIATARAMVHAIDRELVTITAAAQVLATSNRAQAGDVDSFYAQATQVPALRIGANVVLSDTNGQQLLNTFRNPGDALPMHGNLPQLRRVLETRRPVVSDLYVGGVLRRPLISIDVPVMRDGRIAYVISIGELPERFRAILNEQRLPAGWIGAVFDGTGTVVARTHDHDRFMGSKGAPDLVERMARQMEGALETTTLEGIRVLSVFSRSAATGWTVALGIPSDNLLQDLWRRTLLATAATVTLLGLGLLLARSVAGSVARSIRGLVGPAGRIGARERIVVPPLGLEEADEVGRALAHASDLIRSAEHRAGHDALTELANRALFAELVAHEIETCKRDDGRIAVLFIDLDGFKAVNDVHGHETGDALLQAVASRIRAGVRAADIPARIGGDEFAVCLMRADDAAAADVAGKLLDALSRDYALQAATVGVSASIGVAAYPDAGTTFDELIRNADRAMYQAKAAGKARYSVAARQTAAPG